MLPSYLRFPVIFSIIAVLSKPVQGQQQVSGKTVHGWNDTALSTVRIENMTTHQSTYSDSSGIFTIRVKDGEIISFEKPGFDRVYLKAGTEPAAMVKMIPVPDLFLGKQNIDTAMLSPYQRDSLRRYHDYRIALERPPAKAKFYISPTGIGITNPVSSWMQYIAPRSKRRIAFQKNFNKWEEAAYIQSRYNEEIVMEITGATHEIAALFIAQHPMSIEFARTAGNGEILMWISSKYKEWKRYHR